MKEAESFYIRSRSEVRNLKIGSRSMALCQGQSPLPKIVCLPGSPGGIDLGKREDV